MSINQFETDGSENIDSFTGDLWAAHDGAADLLVTNKEFELCFSVLLNPFSWAIFFDWNCFVGSKQLKSLEKQR